MAARLPLANIVLDLLPDAVCMVDPAGHFLYVNAAFECIFGYRPADALGMQMLDLVHPDDRAVTLQVAGLIMQGQAQPHFRNRYLHRDGHVLDIQWSARWLPEYGVRLAVGHEVTALRGAERALEHLASHDPLTGLANRAQLWNALHAAVAAADASGQGLAVLFLDLDGFKHINDYHGHAVGDQVLQAVAQRLREAVPPGHLVARVGGDEFVVLLPVCPPSAWQAMADGLRAAVVGCAAPRPLDVSIGVACHPQDGRSADALLHHADAAMYAQKSARRRRLEAAADVAID